MKLCIIYHNLDNDSVCAKSTHLHYKLLHMELQKSCNRNQNSSLMNGCKIALAWCYNGSGKLVTLELQYNICSYIVATKVHKLHKYKVLNIVSCIFYTFCNWSDNIHVIKIHEVAMKLQVIITILECSCKVTCKSPYFS
jgi:hypothetical protein